MFKGDVKLVLFTKGKDGAEAITKTKTVKIDGNVVDAIDTTGAGDSFIGSFLFSLLNDNVGIDDLENLDENTLRKYLLFSNYYAGYSTTKKGAIASYATLDQINDYIKNL